MRHLKQPQRGGAGADAGNASRKSGGSRIIWITAAAAVIAAAAFCAGIFTGRAGMRREDVLFTVTYEHPVQTVYKDANLVKININTASAEELTNLDGIGDTLAERIVTYRSEHGYFKYEYEIMNVSGIGESKYKAIKDYITVK